MITHHRGNHTLLRFAENSSYVCTGSSWFYSGKVAIKVYDCYFTCIYSPANQN